LLDGVGRGQRGGDGVAGVAGQGRCAQAGVAEG
jgi:hypothetical protein